MMKHAKRGGFAIRSMIALSDEYRHAEPPCLTIFNIEARCGIAEKRHFTVSTQIRQNTSSLLHAYFLQ